MHFNWKPIHSQLRAYFARTSLWFLHGGDASADLTSPQKNGPRGGDVTQKSEITDIGTPGAELLPTYLLA